MDADPNMYPILILPASNTFHFAITHSLITAVNTQTQTYTQIHTYAQIPAYVQLPVLFQPHVPSQPSTHLRHSQAPCPTTISANPLVLAKALIITYRLVGISIDGSTTATLDPFQLLHPGDWKSTMSEGLFSIISFLLVLTPILTCPCFNTPDPIIPVYSTLGQVTLPVFRQLVSHDSSSIKVAPLLYYTSVLISTKITTIFSL